MKAKNIRQVTLKAGSTGDNKVWIGAPQECYDEVTAPFSKQKLHMLVFTIPQAEAAIEMLFDEVDRLKRGET
jgi:hypothetical protein